MNDLKVKDIMTNSVITLSPDDYVTKVEEIFKTNNIHHIPIVDEDNKVVGIISKTDFLMACQSLTFYNKDFKDEKNQRLFRSLLTSDLMTKQVAKLNEEDSVMVAAGIFKENLFHALPIVNANNKLVGIVSMLDLINYAYRDRVPVVF